MRNNKQGWGWQQPLPLINGVINMDSEKIQDVNAEWARQEWLDEKLGDEDRSNFCVFCSRSNVGLACPDCGEYKGVMSKDDAVQAGYKFCSACHELIADEEATEINGLGSGVFECDPCWKEGTE